MLLLFIITGAFPLACSVKYQYHFVENRMNWTEAQRHCRQTYTDLATVCSKDDMGKLTAAFPSDFTGVAWIGLERGPQRRWQWSFSDKDFYIGSDLNFRNWRRGHPNLVSMEDRCAVLESNGKWFDDTCSTQRHFVCFNESAVGDQKYVLMEENKSWREAQHLCRKRHIDLVSVRSPAENQAVRAVVKSQAWIGLFSDPWVWSDLSNSSFRFWGPNQPNNFKNVQDCVAIRYNNLWNDLRCNISRKFFCYSDMDAQSASPQPVIADPQIAVTPTKEHDQASTPFYAQYNNQITTTTDTHHNNQMATTTDGHHITTTDTSDMHHSNQITTTADTPFITTHNTDTTRNTKPVTTKGIPQPIDPVTSTHHTYTQSPVIAATNTSHNTDFTVSTSRPELTQTYHTGQTQNSTRGHVPAQTVTIDTPHGSSHQLTTSYTIQTVTSEEEISAHTAIHQTIDDPAPTSSLFKDTLILVRENMSWIEALTYCQTHHSDLVSVTHPHVQQEVAQKVGNASTPHVWLGLRYTCKFSFWFWISSASVCYQNWAQGHSPGGQRQCGLAGAVEASRGNQWVSLPETHRLNFICRL